jgi:L-fuculose-phosphate aldolase
VKYSRLLYERGLVGAAGGNVSMKINNYILITAGGKSLRDVELEDILVLNENIEIIEAKLQKKPSKETVLHISIYQVRNDIDSVIHVHPIYVTGYSVRGKQIPIITASSRLKLKEVPLVGYADPGSSELAALVKNCVKESPGYVNAVALTSHGLIAFAKGLSTCFDITELVEETAKIAFISENLKI